MNSNYPKPLTLHWGVGFRTPKDWNCPPETIFPEQTIVFDKKLSAQTKFQQENDDPFLTINFQKTEKIIKYLNFVLKETNSVFLFLYRTLGLIITLKTTL